MSDSPTFTSWKLDWLEQIQSDHGDGDHKRSFVGQTLGYWLFRHLNEGTHVAKVGLDRLMEVSGLGRQSTLNGISWLIERGHVKKTPGVAGWPGRGHSSIYRPIQKGPSSRPFFRKGSTDKTLSKGSKGSTSRAERVHFTHEKGPTSGPEHHRTPIENTNSASSLRSSAAAHGAPHTKQPHLQEYIRPAHQEPEQPRTEPRAGQSREEHSLTLRRWFEENLTRAVNQGLMSPQQRCGYQTKFNRLTDLYAQGKADIGYLQAEWDHMVQWLQRQQAEQPSEPEPPTQPNGQSGSAGEPVSPPCQAKTVPPKDEAQEARRKLKLEARAQWETGEITKAQYAEIIAAIDAAAGTA